MCHLFSLSAAPYRTDSRNSRRTDNGPCRTRVRLQVPTLRATGTGPPRLLISSDPGLAQTSDDQIAVNTEQLSVAVLYTANRTNCCALPKKHGSTSIATRSISSSTFFRWPPSRRRFQEDYLLPGKASHRCFVERLHRNPTRVEMFEHGVGVFFVLGEPEGLVACRGVK